VERLVRLVEGEHVDLQASAPLPGQRFGTRLGIGKLAGLVQPLQNLADESLPQTRRMGLRPRGRCGQEIGTELFLGHVSLLMTVRAPWGSTIV
jgi:hypothetical protein